jgi:hypothetical protein
MWSIGLAGSMLDDAIVPDMPVPTTPQEFYTGPYQNDPGEFAKDIDDSRFRWSFNQGSHGGEQFPAGSGARFMQTSAPLTPGMSGGPTVIIDSSYQPRVVGINSYIRDMQPINFVSSTETITGLLQSNDIPSSTTMVPELSPTSSASDEITPPGYDRFTDALDRNTLFQEQMLREMDSDNALIVILAILLVLVLVAFGIVMWRSFGPFSFRTTTDNRKADYDLPVNDVRQHYGQEVHPPNVEQQREPIETRGSTITEERYRDDIPDAQRRHPIVKTATGLFREYFPRRR